MSIKELVRCDSSPIIKALCCRIKLEKSTLLWWYYLRLSKIWQWYVGWNFIWSVYLYILTDTSRMADSLGIIKPVSVYNLVTYRGIPLSLIIYKLFLEEL